MTSERSLTTGIVDPSTLNDRDAITDAVLRFAEGLDDDNYDLVRSALTEDGVVDMSSVNEYVGVLEGRETVAQTLVGNLGKMDTTHHVSNVRISISGDSAEMTCHALAQHFRPGEGRSPDHQDYMLRGNRYRAHLVRSSDWWRITHLVITAVWLMGDANLVTAR